MSFDIAVTGDALAAVERIVPQLVSDLVASRITAQDPTLWGADAEAESSVRLGWTEAIAVSRPLVDDILALRDRLRSLGVDRIILCGMGGSSLAPEVISRTAGVPLTILDTTDPDQIRAVLDKGLRSSAVVIASKSGSTVETDSHRRLFEREFEAAKVDPQDRIVIVTDPESPLDSFARAAGYRVFNADPHVGGRYSALTAFGLVPAGLAGVDLDALLDEAESVAVRCATDRADNPALVLGAAIAGTKPLRDKLGIVADGTHIMGLGDWIEQLIAESTGKNDTGLLPVVLEHDAPELEQRPADLQVVRLVQSARATHEVIEGEIEISATLGAHFLVWEYATAIAGRLLRVNPFDQPDVESAKIAARSLLDAPPEVEPAAFVDAGIEVRATPGLLDGVSTVAGAIERLLAELGDASYVSVQAYLDRVHFGRASDLRRAIAELSNRPTTFGWGPRFLHSTGQFHKGGPKVGVFLQLTSRAEQDLDIPGRPFSFGQLIQSQAAGDAGVLGLQRRPVLTLTLVEGAHSLDALFDALRASE
ncbi:MAG: glucose-6-phosphate isomerase [Cryobacterium sp.]|nr:glucose-6-phosphate isomerase [Cryobacterium sp.]